MNRLSTARFPYLRITLRLPSETLNLEAYLDTGFTGTLSLPPSYPGFATPVGLRQWELADGSVVELPFLVGTIEIPELARSMTGYITAGGPEPIIGRGISDLFKITLDHGRQLIVEP